MKNAEQLANRFREVLLNGKWIANTNFQEQLKDVTFEQATTNVSTLNTIALLTFHINYYIDGLNHFFETGNLEIRDMYSFDMPVLHNKADWNQVKEDLTTNANKFAKHIESFSDSKLAQHFVKEEYGTYARNVEAMIEHSYYHLGQISLIKKLVSQPS